MKTDQLHQVLAVLTEDRRALLACHTVPPEYTEIPREDTAAITALADYDAAIRAIQAALAAPPVEPFQQRVRPWLLACFGPMIAGDPVERNHRFLEESLELVQACGCTQSEAHQLVDYVFGRPIGEPVQEVGGVMVTLAALCLAQGLDMHAAGEAELARIWTKVEAIRAKQAAKPKHSPLPEHTAPQPQEAAPEPGERGLLRALQAATVMPLIGPLLDAWENADREAMEEEPELAKWLSKINRAMETAGEEGAQR